MPVLPGQKVLSHLHYNLTALFLTSADTGYINNLGGLFKTTDGGNTWTDQNLNFSGVLGVQFASENVGYFFTLSSIYKTVNAGGYVGMAEHKNADGLKVFPNPARDLVSVSSKKGDLKNIEIIDLTGKKVGENNRNFDAINLSEIAPGIYFLKIERSSYLVVRKLVVR